MNLNRLFKLVSTRSDSRFYRADCGEKIIDLYIELLVGGDCCGQLSVPEDAVLDLNQYSHLTFGFSNDGGRTARNLLCDCANSQHFNLGHMNTRETLLEVLKKLGFSFMPDDAGDGE